jgi:Amt family ammonium transporter
VISSSGIDSTTSALCIFMIALVPLAVAGLALINTGFGRARNAAYAMFSSLVAIAIAAIVFCLCGFSWEGFPGRPEYVVLLGGRSWGWIASEPFLLRGLTFNGSAATLATLLQVFVVGLAALIPVSAGADRWRLRSVGISTALFAGWTYPLFAHWVWGGGWLAQLGSNFGLGHGFLDAGGAGTVQALGGLSALSICWVLGSRRGKYPASGSSGAIPGHNIVYVLFGCALIVPGWIGMNAAGAILFAGVDSSQIVLIAVNTMLSASASFLVTVVATRIRFGKPDSSICANGWLGGLVASSAICCFVTPVSAIVVGLIAGVLLTISIEVLETHSLIDDPGGAVSIHAVAGLWGLLAVGIFPHVRAISGVLSANGQNGSGQLLAQILGIATLLGVMLPMSYGINWLLSRLDPQRVARQGERVGMDLHELGGSAYPEFAIRGDD